MGDWARVFVAALMLSSALVTVPSATVARDQGGAYVEAFYVDLAQYGRWVEHAVYGMVWVPANGTPDWHPYTQGRWVWTNDYGWYWDSDEDFGWATYHYGRWVLTAEYGWAWVPGDVWGPAWVDWRYGDGHVGWAPMPPEHRWQNGSVVSASVDLGTPKYSKTWVFVSSADFARGDTKSWLAAERNDQLLTSSARVTDYKMSNGKIANRSIDRARLSADTKVSIATAQVSTATSGTGAEFSRLRSAGVIPVYRPQLSAKPSLNLQAPDIDFSQPGERFEAPAVKETAPAAASATPHGSVDVGAGTTFGSPSSSSRRSETGGGGVGVGGIGVGGGGIKLGR